MKKPIVYATIILLAISSYFLVKSSNLNQVPAIYFIFPIVLILPSAIFSGLFVLTARIVLPMAYACFAVALFSFGFSNLAISDFYNIRNFGINDEIKFTFQAEDNFFNAITVLFSIMSAFLLWKGLTDFDRLKEVLNEEAETIWAIVFLTTYLREDTDDRENRQNIDATDKICEYFDEYVCKATGVSEKSKRAESIIALKSSDRLVDQCVAETKKIIVKKDDENDRIALEEIMKNLSHLVSVRSKRRVCMDTSMPPYILFSILIMSISLLLPFLGNGSSILSMSHVYVFMLSFIHMFIFMTLLDLSSPFDGHFSIQLGAFTDAGERIKELISEREQKSKGATA